MTTATEAKPKLIPISEIYGPVVQGEGPLAGRPTVFVRTGGCDYRCSWCDSLYAVDPKFHKDWVKQLPADVAMKAMLLMPTGSVPHITISGGNPAIHDLSDVVRKVHHRGGQVAVETQGTIHNGWLEDVDQLIVSPKPPSAGNVTDYGRGSVFERIVYNHIALNPNRVRAIKIVIFEEADYSYASDVHRAFLNVPMFLQVGTHVGLSDNDDLLKRLRSLQDRIIHDRLMFDCHASIQQHVLLHGHKRGI